MPSATLAPTPTVAGLLERLKAGGDVAPDELVRAEAAERLDRLRAEAADRAAADRAEAERHERIAALRADLPRRLDPAPIAEARAEMVAALDAWAAACARHDGALAAAHSALEALGPLPPDLHLDGHGRGSIVAGGATYRRALVQTTIAVEAAEAIKTHYPRQSIDLGRPTD